MLFSVFALDVGAQTHPTPGWRVSDAQVSRGAGLYQEVCENCHGPDLAGGKVVPGIVGDDFVREWSGKTLRELFTRLVDTMPPAGEPSIATREQMVDVLAYLLRANGWSGGGGVLSNTSRHLDEAAFSGTHP